jgi:hypothetical protein
VIKIRSVDCSILILICKAKVLKIKNHGIIVVKEESVMTVKDIIKICNGKLLCGDENIVCENFSKDTRTVIV